MAGKVKIVWLIVIFLCLSFSFKKKPPTWQVLYSQAEELAEQGDYLKAIEKFQEIIEKYPYSKVVSKAQFRIGECYLALGMEKEAREQLWLYINNERRNHEDLAKAYDYLRALDKKNYLKTLREKDEQIKKLERERARLKEALNWLQQTVNSEEIYLEINLEKDELYIKMGTQILYSFPIVSGKGKAILKLTGEERDFSTPRGIFEIIGKEENPVWYRPDWSWLEKGEEPPPNLTREERAVEGVLGKYRIHFGGGYSIHGTKSGKIKPGKYSHGCIRMNAKDLEKVWEMTEIGTKIYIY